jgi:hypothetical protein
MPEGDPPADRPEAEASEPAEAEASGSFIEDKVVPLIAEPSLGPVWVVLVAHFAAFGAWAILIAWEQGRISAYLGAFGLFWLTGTAAVAEVRQRGRPGALSALVAAVWATTLGFAFAAHHWGIF